jgi:cytosine/adenosine deaminase-related metal-dependent hydrolase
MASNSILLQGGTILTHGAGDHVNAIEADLLIEGNTISKIAKGIKVGAETEVIDCAGKLLSPGFVDTHHHVWQTLLKGRHANQLLMDYFPSGILIWKIVFRYANILRKFHIVSVYRC